MINKTLIAKKQISPFIKRQTITSGNKLRFPSHNKQSYSSQKLKTLNIQSSDSLQNLTKQPHFNNKKIRFLSAQNKSNNTLFKSSQELHEQNSSLKRKIQTFNTNFGKQKVRKEIDIKNMKKIHQKLNMEYSGQIFMDIFPHHKYLVEGVKYQYYKLKQQFQQKCNQLNQVLKQSNNIQNAELKIYCEALENDNRFMKERVAKMLKVEQQMFKQMQFQQKMEISQDGCIQASKQWIKEQEKNMIQLLGVSSKIAELEKKTNDAIINYEKLKEKSQIQRQLLKQRKYKIIFLQNIIRKKENEIHSIKKKSQNDLRQKNKVIKRLSQNIEQQQRRHKQAIQTLLLKNKKKLQTHKDVYQRYLRQSEKQCQTYKREIKRLQLMIKSLENNGHNHNNIPFSKKQKNNICLHKQQRNQRQQVKQQAIDQFSLTFQKEGYFQEEQNRQMKNLQLLKQQSNRNNQIRYIKSSSIKHSINCIKVKPVKMQEIQHLKQQLKYRFIYHRVQIDTVKEYFTLSQSEIDNLFKNEQQWLRKYIPLKQIKQKLLKTPFTLSPEMVLLFSRYIVEDYTKDTVYYHEDNEIERVLAKSIVRSFVGQYILPNEKESKEEITKVLNEKGNNLRSVLFLRAPSGSISYSKLRQICETIEVYFSEAAWDYLISQLSIESSIYQMYYKDMFKYI